MRREYGLGRRRVSAPMSGVPPWRRVVSPLRLNRVYLLPSLILALSLFSAFATWTFSGRASENAEPTSVNTPNVASVNNVSSSPSDIDTGSRQNLSGENAEPTSVNTPNVASVNNVSSSPSDIDTGSRQNLSGENLSTSDLVTQTQQPAQSPEAAPQSSSVQPNAMSSESSAAEEALVSSQSNEAESSPVEVAQPREPFSDYTVASGDTLTAIATRFGVSVEALVQNNQALQADRDSLAPGATLRVPTFEGLIYDVQPGDTLLSIAQAHGIDLGAVVVFEGNRISDADDLSDDAVLLLPGARPVPRAQPPANESPVGNTPVMPASNTPVTPTFNTATLALATASAEPQPAPAISTPVYNGRLTIGYPVQASAGGGCLNERLTPGGEIAGCLQDGLASKIVAGPEYANGYWWWQLTNGNWSVDDYLAYREAAQSATPAVQTPIVQTIEQPAPPAPQPQATLAYNGRLSVGHPVVISAGGCLNTRSSPMGGVNKCLPDGFASTIVDGPVYAGGYWWWKLSGQGWSADEYLAYNDGNRASASQGSSSPASSSGFIWPTSGRITDGFGLSRSIGTHGGIDIAHPGTHARPVLAVASGRVTAVSYGYGGGLGNHIVIAHDGGLETVYAHLSSASVSPGQSVSQGQTIGNTGCTGLCFGEHLHFEVRRSGIRMNPLNYLP